VPVRLEHEKLYIAMADPMDVDAADEIENYTGLVVVPMVAPQTSLEQVLKRYYPEEGRVSEEKAETAASIFPELIREINDLDLFGRYFTQINDRLDRIEGRLGAIEALLESRSAGSPDP